MIQSTHCQYWAYEDIKGLNEGNKCSDTIFYYSDSQLYKIDIYKNNIINQKILIVNNDTSVLHQYFSNNSKIDSVHLWHCYKTHKHLHTKYVFIYDSLNNILKSIKKLYNTENSYEVLFSIDGLSYNSYKNDTLYHSGKKRYVNDNITIEYLEYPDGSSYIVALSQYDPIKKIKKEICYYNGEQDQLIEYFYDESDLLLKSIEYPSKNLGWPKVIITTIYNYEYDECSKAPRISFVAIFKKQKKTIIRYIYK